MMVDGRRCRDHQRYRTIEIACSKEFTTVGHQRRQGRASHAMHIYLDLLSRPTPVEYEKLFKGACLIIRPAAQMDEQQAVALTVAQPSPTIRLEKCMVGTKRSTTTFYDDI